MKRATSTFSAVITYSIYSKDSRQGLYLDPPENVPDQTRPVLHF